MYFIFPFLVLIYSFLFSQNDWIKWFSVAGVLLIAILWRVNSWMYPYSLCIDEAEYMALAGRAAECGIPYRCFNGSTSGFLSIGFVTLIKILGLKLTYFNLRLIGFLVCIIPSMVFIYAGLKRWYGQHTAGLVFPWMAMFMVFGFYNREFLSYNTEYLLLLFYSIIYYLYAGWKQLKFEHNKEPLLIALLLGMLPYFKLQAVPFVFAFYVLLFWNLWRSKRWLSLAFVHLMLAIPSLLFLSYFLYQQVFHDFYKMYIESNMFYVDQPVVSYRYSDNEFIHRLRAFKGLHVTTFLPFYLSLIPIVLMNFKRLTESLFGVTGKAAVWIFLWVCYSTYAPGTGFGHYNMLLLVPVLYVLGSICHNLQEEKMEVNRWLTMLGVIITSVTYLNRAEAYPVENRYLSGHTEKYIMEKTPKKEPVLFLGYYEALEAIMKTERTLPLRNATSHYICLDDSALRNYFQTGFFEDMKNSKPLYVVDMEEVLNRPGLMPLKNYIHMHYDVDTVIEGNRVYRIKIK